MKKQLLKENEIRKMMKFANIGALTDGFVEKLNETVGLDEEELNEQGMPEEDPAAGPPGGGDLEGAGDIDAAAEVPDEEVPGEEGEELEEPDEAEGEEGDVLSMVQDALETFVKALEAAGPAGQEAAQNLSIEAGEGEDAEMADAGGMDDMGDMDLAGMDDMGGGDVDPAAGAGGPPPEEEEVVAEVVSEDALVNEVARRVARRLRRGRRR